MGGRGTVSVSGGKIHIGSLYGGANDVSNVGGSRDRRDDVRRMFEMSGFSDVRGLDGMDTAVIGSYAITLQNLEGQYGAVEKIGGRIEVLGMDSASAIAAVRLDYNDTANALLLNRNALSSISGRSKAQRSAEASGWLMPSGGDVRSLSQYAVTHEYGHLLQNAYFQRDRKSNSGLTEGRHARSQANQILRIAKNKYGATQKDVSTYGSRNSNEFFAEAFANAHSGNPNAIGKAMNDWLRQNRL